MFSKIKSLFSRKPFPKSQQVIEFAFESGGTKYYKHTSEANIPYKRALKVISIYNELDMKCTRNYLIKHTQAFKNILAKTPFKSTDLFELMKLNNQLSERLEFIYDTDLVYKLASVVYFDEKENPEDYDWSYCQKKIDKWKKDKDINDFFLSMPISELVPFLKDFNMNFDSYSQIQLKQTQEHLANISMNLLEVQKADLLNPSKYLWQEEAKAN
jgi:hypothetical protein